MKEDQLILCYVGSTQQSTPPMTLLGRFVSEENGRLVIKAPVSGDIAYFSLVGKRLKPLMDARELQRSKEDKSMRALPQLAPSDFVMMGCNNCTDYMESTMTIYSSQLVYITPIVEGSSFDIAYNILMDQIKQDTALSEFFNESVFEFDSAGYLTKLMDPDTVKEVLVPVAVQGDTSRQ